MGVVIKWGGRNRWARSLRLRDFQGVVVGLERKGKIPPAVSVSLNTTEIPRSCLQAHDDYVFRLPPPIVVAKITPAGDQS
jgi:hypothetical protein